VAGVASVVRAAWCGVVRRGRRGAGPTEPARLCGGVRARADQVRWDAPPGDASV